MLSYQIRETIHRVKSANRAILGSGATKQILREIQGHNLETSQNQGQEPDGWPQQTRSELLTGLESADTGGTKCVTALQQSIGNPAEAA